MENNKTLYDLGIKYQNDKVTYHRYDLIYSKFLSEIQNKNISMLEIGLGTYQDGTGYSRNMWKEYFPNSTVHVMDIHYGFEDEIGIVVKGDQSNLNDLRNVGNICGQLDLVVDDGSHHPEHQIKTFEFLFKNNLKCGGIYIIEDIECSYWNPQSTVYGYETGYLNILDYFMKLTHEVNFLYSQKPNNFQISQITFAKNCIIIRKQTEEEIEIGKQTYRFLDKL
jgi:hypothetical protein